MKKRIYLKAIHEFEKGLTDALHIYLNRPEGKEFQDISIGILQISLMMLLSYQADKGEIIIGKENRIDNSELKETKYEKNKFIEFEGNIKWIYKKKNIPKEYYQDFSIKFDLTNYKKKDYLTK